MRKPTFLAAAFFLILFLFISPLWARERTSMVFFGFYGEGEHSGTAEALGDLVRVELVNSRQVAVLDSIIVNKSLAEMEALTEGVLSDEDALTTARLLDADFFLKGRVTSLGPMEAVLVEMISSYDGSVILGRTFTVEEGKVRKTAGQISKEVVNSLIVLETVSMADIDTLVEMGKFSEAQKLLERFAILHSVDDRFRTVQEIINKGLGREAYERSTELLSYYLFTEALIEINQAISYDPGNPLYEATAARIKKEEEAFLTEEEAKIIGTLSGLVEEGRYTVAKGLMEKVYERGFTDPSIADLERRIDQGLSEKRHARDAQVALLRHDYITARLEIEEAIRLNPVNGAYGEFLRTLNEQEEEYEESSIRWEAYKGELKTFKPLRLFLDKKAPDRLPEISWLWGTLGYRDVDTLVYDTLPLKGAAAEYTWHWLLPYLSRAGFADLYAGVTAGGRFLTGLAETMGDPDDEGFRDLSADRTTIAELYGGASLELVLLSFLLSVGVEPAAGVFYDRALTRSPAEDTEDSQTLWLPSFTLGLRLGAAWSITESFRLTFLYRPAWSLVTKNGEWEETGYSLYSLGAAFKP